MKWIVVVAALSLLTACGEQEPASAPTPAMPSSSTPAAQATAAPGPEAQKNQQGEGDPPKPSTIGGSPTPPNVQPTPPGSPGRDGQGQAMRLAAVATLAEGKLSRDQVQQTIDGAADTLARCLMTETRVSVKIDVSGAGEVSDASVASSDPDDPKVRDCVAATMKGLRFPPPEGRQPISLSMSLVLKPRVSL